MNIITKVLGRKRLHRTTLILSSALILSLIISPVNLGALNFAQAETNQLATPTKSGSLNIQGSAGQGQIAVAEGKSTSTPGGQVVYRGMMDITKLSASPAKNSGKTLPFMTPGPNFKGPQSSITLKPNIVDIQLPTKSVTSNIATNVGGFEGTDCNPCGVTPPDGGFAVGPNNIFQVVNFQGKIWDKQGNLQADFALSNLGTCVLGCFGDPRVEYDPGTGHWFLTQLDLDFVHNGFVDVAVSQTTNPVGSYFIYTIGFNDIIPDQPRAAVSDDKLTLMADDFHCGNCYDGEEGFFLNKAEMIAGASTSFIHYGIDNTRFHLAPTVDAIDNGPDQWLLNDGTGGSAVELLKVTGTPGVSPVTFSSVAVLPIFATSGVPGGQQPLTSTLIPNSDSRVQSVTRMGTDILWAATDGCHPSPGSSDLRSCIRWDVFSISGSPNVIQDMDIAESGKDLTYPGVSEDTGRQLGANFGFSSLTDYPSIAFAGQSNTSPFGSVDNIVVDKVGSADQLSGRAGDYSNSLWDPTTGNVYGENEYNAAGGGSWDTFVTINSIGTGSSNQHPTTLTLNPIANQPWSGTFGVSGKLTDNAAQGIGVGGTFIAFGYSSGSFVFSTVTAADGTFSSFGIANGAPPAAGQAVQAFYNGGISYAGSSSVVQGYSTVKHTTSLTEAAAVNVPWSAGTSLKATLVDTSFGSTISGKVITWTGTGVLGVAPATTDGSGNAISTGTAPATVNTGWKEQSHFAADANYFASASGVVTYNTLVHKTVLNFAKMKATYPWSSTTSFPVVLTDSDNGGTPIAGESITFTGTGVIGVAPVLTDAFGTAAGTGTSPNTIAAGWTVTGMFAGDGKYAPDNTSLRHYSTTTQPTSLTLVVTPASVAHGGTYKVTGTLKDITTGALLAGQTITFTATSPIVIGSTTTSGTGAFSVTGLIAPSSVGIFNIQAQFAGTGLLSPTNSPTKTLTTT